MARKSKTQKAKASARRAEKKLASQEEANDALKASASSGEDGTKASETDVKAAKKSAADSQKSANAAKQASSKSKKAEAKSAPKKKTGIVKFFNDVRAELKRVTWPTRQDVAQWSGVVVVALLFFGIYVAILDSGIITPLLIAFSGLGA